MEWDCCSQARPATVGFYFERAVQFVQSLAHPIQTDTRFGTRCTQQAEALFSYTLAEISYLQDCSFGFMLKMDTCFRSF